MSAATLDHVLDEAMQLPLDQQEMLLEILKRRQSERNRREIANDASASIAEFRAGTNAEVILLPDLGTHDDVY